MANTYYDSQLTAAEIEAALEAISGVIVPANNGKVLAINNGKLEARSVQWGGSGAVVQPLSVTQNGIYTPPIGVDGYAPVTVNVSGGGGVPLSDFDILSGGMLTDTRYVRMYNNGGNRINPHISGSQVGLDVSIPFEISLTLKILSLENAYRVISGSTSDFWGLPWCQIMNSASDTAFYCVIPLGSSSGQELTISQGDVPVVAGNTYMVKIQFDGSKVTFSATDGTNSKSIEFEISAIYSKPAYWAIGNLAGAGAGRQCYNCEFDMYHCYLKQNGVLIWGNE